MRNFLNDYISGRKSVGIEVSSVENEESYLTCILTKHKNQVSILSTSHNSSISGIPTNIKGLPIQLSITGKRVIIKKIDFVSKEPFQVLMRAFPNIDAKDFFYEVLVNETYSFVSICRKSQVFQIIEEFENSGFTIVGFNLGHLNISRIIRYLSIEQIYAFKIKLIVRDGQILNLENASNKCSFKYDINGLEISSNYICSCLAALGYYILGSDLDGNIQDDNQRLKQNYIRKKTFKLGLRSGLVSIFFLLLLNFILFSYYSGEIENQRALSILSSGNIDQINRREMELSKKEKFIKQQKLNAGSNSMHFINSIVSLLPPEILLTGITLNPIKTRIKENQPIELEKNILLIAGYALDKQDLSEWLLKMENENGFQRVSILKFQETEKGMTVFEIKIEIIDG